MCRILVILALINLNTQKTTVPPLPLTSFMDDAPMQEEVPTQGDASVGRAWDQEEAIDPSPVHGTCDDSDEEDPKEDEEKEGAPEPVSESEQPPLGEELEYKDEGYNSTNIPLNLNDPLPQPTLPKLVLTKDMIDDVKAARLEDDLTEEMLERLWNPPKELESLSLDIMFLMALFNNLIGGSQQMYHDACQMIKHFTGCILKSYHKVKTKVENMTCIAQLQTSMCIRSCVAFMGRFKGLDKCPECNENHYQKNKKSGNSSLNNNSTPSH